MSWLTFSVSAVAVAALARLDPIERTWRSLRDQARADPSYQVRWQRPVLTLDERGVLQSCTSTQALVADDAPVRGVPALVLSLSL